MSCCLCLSEMEILIAVFDEHGLDTKGVAADITKFIGLEIKSNPNTAVSVCIICWAHLENFRTFCRFIQGKQKEFKLHIKKDIKDEENVDACEMANKFEVEMVVSESSLKVEADDVLEEKEPSTKRTRRILRKSKQDSSPTNINHSKKDKQEIAVDDKITPPIRKVGRPLKKDVDIYDDEDRLIASHTTLICDECQMEQETFYDLKQHFKKVHNCEGYVVCCNKHFYKKALLVEHIYLHKNVN